MFLFVVEKNDLTDQLESERTKVAEAEERLTRLGKRKTHFPSSLLERLCVSVTEKSELEGQLKDVEDRLSREEKLNDELTSKKKKLESEIEELKKDIDDLRLNLQKSEN